MSFAPSNYRVKGERDVNYVRRMQYQKCKVSTKPFKQVRSEKIAKDIETFLANPKNKIQKLKPDEFGAQLETATERQKNMRL